MHKKISSFLALISVAMLSIGTPHAAEEVSPIPVISEQWRFSVVPYLWAPGIKGTLNFSDGLVKTADYSSSNVLSNLKTGGMIAGEAHYGKWGVMGDVLSATLQNTGNIPLVVPTRSDGTVRATLAVSYTHLRAHETG
jgi:hypothetical protein